MRRPAAAGRYITGFSMLLVTIALADRVAAGESSRPDAERGVAASWSTGQLTPTRVDFGPAEVTAQWQHQRDDGTAFDAAAGFGWLIAPSNQLPSRDRACNVVETRQRSFVYTALPHRWEIVLANGDYRVDLAAGDCAYAQGPQRVYVEGQALVDDQSTEPGSFVTRNATVRVLDGRLTVEVGGAGGNTTLNFIELSSAASQPAVLQAFNFQPAGAPTPEGFNAETGLAYPGGGDHGWDRDLEPLTRARGLEGNPLLDSFLYVGAQPATFEVDVAPGVYTIQLALGDPAWDQGPHRVVVEGTTLVEGVSSAAGEFLEYRTSATVLDGRLTVEIGGTAGLTTLNYLSVVSEMLLNEVARVDFGPDATPPAAGYQRDAGTAFADPPAYGWLTSGNGLDSRDRGCAGTEDRRDSFVYTVPERRWELGLSNGDYWVTVSVGDCLFAQGPHFVSAEGTVLIDHETTASGAFTLASAKVRVLDGRLSLDVGGGAGKTAIQYVDVVEAADPPAVLEAFNFQPQGSPTPAGFVADVGLPADPDSQWGWDRDLQGWTRSRLAHPDPLLDSFVFTGSQSAVFEAELPPGSYSVKLSLGDPAWAQGPQRAILEGVPVVDGVVTGPGQFHVVEQTIDLLDGLLTLEIGGAAGLTVLNYLSLASVEPPAGLWAVSFQPEVSDVPAGFLSDAGRAYAPERGFGWDDDFLFNAVRTRERGLVAAQALDTFVYTGAPAESWRLDVPNGSYLVSVTVGDAAWAQGPHQVTVEGGSLVAGESTAAGSFLTRTACVEVSDGRLDLEMGGLVGNTTLNSIVVEAATCSPSTETTEAIVVAPELDAPDRNADLESLP